MSTFAYYLREFRKRPLSFLLRRIRDEVLEFSRGVFAALGGKPYSARLRQSTELPLGSLFPGKAIDNAIRITDLQNPDELRHLCQVADEALERKFRIYSRVIEAGDAVDWHRDYFSDYSWPCRFHTRYRYTDLIDLSHPTDVKVPWELSRLQFLPVLALAYRYTRRTEYRRAIHDFILDWDRKNPVGFGVNWQAGMEVALRAISLVLTAEYTNGTPMAEEVASPRLMRLLAEHGRFLCRNIEYSDVNGNHYVSCLLGLLYLGLYLPEKEARAWRSIALAGLRKEILAQTYPDGVCHEGSLPYHRLVLEILIHAAIVCRASGLDPGAEYLSRLERMVEFVAGYLKPCGEAPVWGDADDGRIHALGGQAINDHRYLLALGAALFGRADFLVSAGPLMLDSALLLDQELLSRLETLEREVDRSGEPRSAAFPEGGFFALRGSGVYALIDCGDVGYRGRGGHGHNDALSVEIALQGHDVITDTGCSSYTRSVREREAVISARAHNVALVGNREPAPISLAEGVRIPHATQCPVEVLDWDAETGFFRGRHFGYRCAGDVVVYEREVSLASSRPGITIADSLQGFAKTNIAWRFHLAEIWGNVYTDADGATLANDRGEVRVRIHTQLPGAHFGLERSPYYPSYGARRERWCLVISLEAALPLKAKIEISWVEP